MGLLELAKSMSTNPGTVPVGGLSCEKRMDDNKNPIPGDSKGRPLSTGRRPGDQDLCCPGNAQREAVLRGFHRRCLEDNHCQTMVATGALRARTADIFVPFLTAHRNDLQCIDHRFLSANIP